MAEPRMNADNNNGNGLIEEIVDEYKYYYNHPIHASAVFLIYFFGWCAIFRVCISASHSLGFPATPQCLFVNYAGIVFVISRLYLHGIPVPPSPVMCSTLNLLFRMFWLFFIYFTGICTAYFMFN